MKTLPAFTKSKQTFEFMGEKNIQDSRVGQQWI